MRENDGKRYTGATKAFRTVAYANMDLEKREEQGIANHVVLFGIQVTCGEGCPLYLAVRVDPEAMDVTKFTGRKPVSVLQTSLKPIDLNAFRRPHE